jgi:hypothetical protein
MKYPIPIPHIDNIPPTGIELTREQIDLVSESVRNQLPAYISFLIGYFDGSDFVIYKQIF